MSSNSTKPKAKAGQKKLGGKVEKKEEPPKRGKNYDGGMVEMNVPGVPGARQSVAQTSEDAEKIAALRAKYNLKDVEASAKVDTNRVSAKNQFAEGELERMFMQSVMGGDIEAATHLLAGYGGRELIFSKWGGNMCQTTILYAANKGDSEMCKLLMRYGGNELLQVKDIKQRDAQHYANKHGMKLEMIKGAGGLVDCWNYKVIFKDPNIGKRGSKIELVRLGDGSSSPGGSAPSRGPSPLEAIDEDGSGGPQPVSPTLPIKSASK